MSIYKQMSPFRLPEPNVDQSVFSYMTCSPASADYFVTCGMDLA